MNEIKHGFTLWKKKGVRFLTVPSFEKAGGVTCAMSTRVGGVSPRPYNTLNFSRAREKSEENFRQNFSNFGQAAGFDYKKAVANRYEHGNNVIEVGDAEEGMGIVREELPVFCDGLYTSVEGLPLVTYHADCVPLFFYDPARHSAAVCHAGWKGVSTHIIRKAVESLVGEGSKSEDILAAVGPCISVKHFEVQSDVYAVFEQVFGSDVLKLCEGRVYIDLQKACVADMLAAGIQESNITLSDLCTYDNPRLFYSHRRDKGVTGAMAAVIMLNES